MKVNVSIKLDLGNIKILEDAYTRAAEMTGETILSDIVASQTVPKDTSVLELSGFVDSGGRFVSVIFDTPYARRHYFHPEYNFRTDRNPNAGGLWMQDYLTGYTKEKMVIDAQAKYFKQLSQGVIK